MKADIVLAEGSAKDADAAPVGAAPPEGKPDGPTLGKPAPPFGDAPQSPMSPSGNALPLGMAPEKDAKPSS